MSRQHVEKLIKRMYQHQEKSTGRLPTGKEVKRMEDAAKKTAERADKKRGA